MDTLKNINSGNKSIKIGLMGSLKDAHIHHTCANISG